MNEKIQLLESHFNKRLHVLDGVIQSLKSQIFVQTRVSTALRDEVDRLQQFTRRHCASVFGIKVVKDEKPDDLRGKIDDILKDVD